MLFVDLFQLVLILSLASVCSFRRQKRDTGFIFQSTLSHSRLETRYSMQVSRCSGVGALNEPCHSMLYKQNALPVWGLVLYLDWNQNPDLTRPVYNGE